MPQPKQQKFLPGAYIADGHTLLWVIERIGTETLLVENVKTGEEIEVGDADLIGYSLVRKGNDDE